MNKLSRNAIRVLEDIKKRGLLVLWSFGVPHPYYDDSNQTPMSDEEWRIVRSELGRVVIKSQYIVTRIQRKITRQSVRNGLIVTEQILVMPDGDEFVKEHNSSPAYAPAPDGIISEDVEITNEGHWEDYTAWESDYLTVEHVEQDDYTEEFVGILHRYSSRT